MATDLGQFLGGGGSLTTATYNAPGNFAVPSNTNVVFVTATGGGGKGGPATSPGPTVATVGAGGSSGSALIQHPYFVNAGSNIPITVGSGGATSMPSQDESLSGVSTIVGNIIALGGVSYNALPNSAGYLNYVNDEWHNIRSTGPGNYVDGGRGTPRLDSNDINRDPSGRVRLGTTFSKFSEDKFGTRITTADYNDLDNSNADLFTAFMGGAPGLFGPGGTYLGRSPSFVPESEINAGPGASAAAGTGAGGAGGVSSGNATTGGNGGSGRAIISYYG